MRPAQRAAIERAKARQGTATRRAADKCAWFALCDHPPVTTRDHPILGPVAICARCDDKVETIERATKGTAT